jgi:hypothetical protein
LLLKRQSAKWKPKTDSGTLQDTDTERVAKTIVGKLLQPAMDLGMTRYKKSRRQHRKESKKTKLSKPWFNRECKSKRRRYLKLKKRLQKIRTEAEEER